MLPLNEETIIQAIQKTLPAVVNVKSVRVLRDRFFRVFPLEGQGSGVLFDSRGYVITNNHVIDGAEQVKVSLQDERNFDGEVIGTDPETDVAVVRITGEHLPVAELGDSDTLRVGQITIAIGNPFALDGGPTATAGVLSGVNRRVQADTGIMDLIQTDAAINPGNSGGPLVDSQGKVIGINTMVIPFARGIGFAIPVNIVKTIAEELIREGRIVRPWMGLSTLQITNALAQYYELPVQEGLLVVEVAADSPAETVGIDRGDLIVKVDNNPIKESQAFAKDVRSKSVGDSIKVEIIRDGRRGTIDITLAETPAPRIPSRKRLAPFPFNQEAT